MKFSEIPYQRPDLEAAKTQFAALVQAFQAAGSFQEAERIYLEMEQAKARFFTQRTLASIRRDINTNDSFYDGEKAWFDQVCPELEKVFQDWDMAQLSGAFRKDFEEKYGSVSLRNAEMGLKTFSPAVIADLQKENQLVASYTKLLASAQIPFEGKHYTLAQLATFKEESDDARRLAAWTAEGQWYLDHSQELDRIYDDLVHLRTDIARKLGFENYIGLGYCRMKRNCYDQNDVRAFREAVRKYVVPVADQVYRSQAQRLGKQYPMNFADNALEFRSGNPRPVGNPEEILKMGSVFYRELSQETNEFWTSMRENEMMDVLSRTGKAGGGYCTNLSEYHTPFIFANFNGTSHDVKVITHEAGHAFAGYLNRNRVPSDTRWPSMEGCEVHSMSMEFFAWPWTDGFFGADARKFRYSHLAYALCFLPYGTMVDEFQHRVYQEPDMTPQQRHEVWRELLGIYMPWMKLGEIPFYGQAMGWQRQSHIYKTPFYYIDYCLAQTVALEFWSMIQEDAKAAFQVYLRYAKLGGSMVFTDLLKEAGLESPFQESCLRGVCEKAADFLAKYDLTGIV